MLRACHRWSASHGGSGKWLAAAAPYRLPSCCWLPHLGGPSWTATTTPRRPFEPTGKRRWGFPLASPALSAAAASSASIPSSWRSWAGTTRAHAARAVAFRRCCRKTGRSGPSLAWRDQSGHLGRQRRQLGVRDRCSSVGINPGQDLEGLCRDRQDSVNVAGRAERAARGIRHSDRPTAHSKRRADPHALRIAPPHATDRAVGLDRCGTGRHVLDVPAETLCADFHKPLRRKCAHTPQTASQAAGAHGL
jgi:hypothetical protein